MVNTHKYRKNISRIKKNTKKNILTNTKLNHKIHHLIDEVTLGKQLGKGMMGTVFLAHDKKGNKYAYKIERILPEAVKKTFKSSYWRENDFAQTLANKHPEHFMVLYDSKIDSDCKHHQDFSGFNFKMEDLSKSLQNYYTKLKKSPYCSVKLWSIIDDTVEKLFIPKLMISKKVLCNLFIQIIYIVFLINNSGYVHNDFHIGNIGYVKTDKKTVNILGNNIQTHGYLIKAIDYGLVLHDKYTLSKGERINYDNAYDLLTVVNMFSIEIKNEKIAGKEWDWGNEWSKPIKISKKEKEELEKYLPEGKKLNKDNYDFIIDKLYKLIEWKKWQQHILGDNTIQGVEPSYLIPLNDMLFLIKNLYNPKKILEYLISRAQSRI